MEVENNNRQERNAWVLRMAPEVTIGRYSITFAIDEPILAQEGDGVLIVDADGSTISRFARIYRIRRNLREVTLYFDGVAENTSAVAVSFEGNVQVLSRIEWDRFAATLQAGAGIGFEELPVLRGNDVHERTYIRELLQLATTDDLLGPAGGPEEEIVGMGVRDRYLVGKLAPQTSGAADGVEGLHGQMAGEEDESEDTTDTPADLTPLEEIGEGRNKGARRRLPGEEFASTDGGRSSADEDDEQAIDANQNQSLVPSSMGLTFCVDVALEQLILDVRWGRYERRESEEQVDNEGRPMRAWKRIPSGGQIVLHLDAGQINPIPPDETCPEVSIRGIVREPLPSGDRLVTVFLVNEQPEPEQNRDGAWLFQPEIIVRHASGEAVFRRRPHGAGDGTDSERAALEMIYRRQVEFAVGHCVSVHAETPPNDPEHAFEVKTTTLPEYEVPITEPPGRDPQDRPAHRRLVDEGLLDMQRLATMDRSELIPALSILTDDYEQWIAEQQQRVGSEIVGFDEPAELAMDQCTAILERLRAGITSLAEDEEALRAFQFANEAMARQRIRSLYALDRRRGGSREVGEFEEAGNRSWRPFQLAFVLLSVPALADPTHPDRTGTIESYADLLWFPTGGGKTEAYLGVAAFTMAIRRRQGDLGGLDATRGLAVIMRYTLRLLTIQQFQRAAALLCSMETIRQEQEDIWGSTPFTLGLWVGQRVAPNDTEESHFAIAAERNNQRPTGSSPAQLTFCPWCGSEILPGRDIEVRRFKSDIGRTLIYCGDALGRCEFSRAKAEGVGLPVLVVDDEIYRHPPSMLIATVDKFAMMAWRGQVRTLFGQATEACPRHGLLWPGSECTGRHKKYRGLESTQPITVTPVRPPDLIIQDEFHLISGPLGTMVGLYETTVDELSSWQLGDVTVRPKVIASTATVRKANEQINNVFLRRVAVFPPSGLDAEDNFFSIQRPIAERPGRRYMGICSPGAARPAVLIRVYTALLTAAQALFERFGAAVDPYMTTVGYFNSLRELGGMRRLAEDDVQTRAFRVAMSRVARPGLAQRSVKVVDELTSRVTSRDIPDKLDLLELPFRAAQDPDTGSYHVHWEPGEDRAVDVVMATNMLSVGVDISRLGLMAVNGQPKNTAEYIQATSRVGRQFPGLVCTVLAWSRPRDLSHYESFEHYHATFYKHVEAQSVTPFAPRALDRGLTGAMVGWVRQARTEYNPNLGAMALDSTTKAEVAQMRDIFSQRGWRVTDTQEIRSLTEDMVNARCDQWASEAARPGRRLAYEARRRDGDDVAGLLRKPGFQAWGIFTVPMSLREVEQGVRLIMDSSRLDEGPAWRSRPPEDGDGEGEDRHEP
jgi:hypothetical protein